MSTRKSPRKKNADVASAIKSEPDTTTMTDEKQGNNSNNNNQRATTTKKRRRKTFDENAPDSFTLPHERKTAAGGYAHTSRSKSRISKANSGNTPWNKGKNRSSADRAKIAAGVRARNRAQLLKKLKKLGLSEEEWNEKKKEIKYLRERIRRAKLTNSRHARSVAEKKLAEALKATDEKSIKTDESKMNQDSEEEDEEKQEKEETKEEQDEEQDTKQQVPKKPEYIFTRDVEFTPHAFDIAVPEALNVVAADDEDEDAEHPSSQSTLVYAKVCPNDGPGGLICCQVCCDAYTKYLSQTSKDIELSKTNKAGKEVKEILAFMEEGCVALDRAAQVARKKVPPLPLKPPAPEPLLSHQRRFAAAAATNSSSSGSRKSTIGGTFTRSEQEHASSMEWNLTSAVDIEGLEGYAVV